MQQGPRVRRRCPLSPHRHRYLHTSGSGLGFFPQPWAHLAICLPSYLHPVFLSKTKVLIPPTRHCASWLCPIIVHGSAIHPGAQAYLLGCCRQLLFLWDPVFIKPPPPSKYFGSTFKTHPESSHFLPPFFPAHHLQQPPRVPLPRAWHILHSSSSAWQLQFC